MRKADRKRMKHAHIQAAIQVQNDWIAKAFGLEAEGRKERDQLFAQAKAKLA